MSAPETKPEAKVQETEQLTALQLIERCMQRATKVTIRQRRNKRGTSITISFSKPE